MRRRVDGTSRKCPVSTNLILSQRVGFIRIGGAWCLKRLRGSANGAHNLLTSELLHGAGVSPVGRDNVYSHG